MVEVCASVLVIDYFIGLLPSPNVLICLSLSCICTAYPCSFPTKLASTAIFYPYVVTSGLKNKKQLDGG